MTLSINDSQHRRHSIIALTLCSLSQISPFMLTIIMLDVVTVSVLMLNIVTMSVVMLNVVAPPMSAIFNILSSQKIQGLNAVWLLNYLPFLVEINVRNYLMLSTIWSVIGIYYVSNFFMFLMLLIFLPSSLS